MEIKIINKKWSKSINFIDENNVFVGFDWERCCCEDYGYFITHDKDKKYSYDDNHESNNITEHEGYLFDKNYMEYIESEDLDEGCQVCFRLTKEGAEDLYLHLYNSHNGYYGHGFTFEINGNIKRGDI